MPWSLGQRWQEVAALVAEHLDVITARPGGEAVPPAFADRGWQGFLLSLPEAEVALAELHGLGAALEARCAGPEPAPESLRALVCRAREAVALPSLVPAGGEPGPDPAARGWRRASLRKQDQVRTLVRLVHAHPGLRQARRIVDVGSGHGHLARELSLALGAPAVGLERSADRVAVARRLDDAVARRLDQAAAPPRPGLSHLQVDVLQDSPRLQPGDLGMGLHACGELGDALVRLAAGSALPVVLVGCCAQKQRSPVRQPLVAPGVALPREALGLANLLPLADGVERSLQDNIAARQRRAELLELLLLRGCQVVPGEEMRGLNRRRAHADLAALGEAALALRGLVAPTAAELTEAAARGARRHRQRRRLALPRTVLGRVLEVYLLLDRAAALQAAGHEVQVGELFGPEVSPRNLALVATPG